MELAAISDGHISKRRHKLVKVHSDFEDMFRSRGWVVYWIKGSSQYSVEDIIGFVDRIDFGTAFGYEWKKRKKVLMKAFPEMGELSGMAK